MNCDKFLRLNLIYFQLFGLYPYQIVRPIHSTINKTLICTLTLFNLTSVTLQTAFVFFNYDIVFERPMLLGKVVDMFKYGYLVVTCLTILIESIVTVDEQISFWDMSANLQQTFQKNLPSDVVQNLIYKKNLLKTYAVTVVFIWVQIYLTLQRICFFCSCYTVLAIYAFIRYLQYIMYVDIIHQQATNLGCELDQIIEISTVMTSSNNGMSDKRKHKLEVVLVGRLKMASNLYVKLYDMSVTVNSALGWSLIFNLVLSYIQIFVEFFWMFQILENDLDYFDECLISVVPSLLIVWLVFYTTTDCHQKTHAITMKVHKIKEHENPSKLSTLIHNFILQTQHLPIILDANGFFSMNFVTLKDMIASITTFMVFIIQSTVSAKFKIL